MSSLFLALSCTNASDDALAALSLTDALDAAESTYGVPRDLVATIAHAETRFDPHLEELELHHSAHPEARFGVMGLAGQESRATGPTLEAAAACLERDPSLLIHDSGLNVLGAACLLAEAASELNEGELVREADWAEVVGWYSGSDDGSGQLSYVRQVYRLLENGFSARAPDGTLIEVAPREVDLPMLELVYRAAGDSALISNFVSASSSNYTNQSRSSGTIDMIVVHTAQGSYTSVYNWFANSSANASAHYVIRSSDGEITQMVWEEDKAWHSGHSTTNGRSVGIELEGYIEQPGTYYTDAMYTSLAALILDIADRQGVAIDRQHIIGHNEVPGCSYSSGGGASCHTDPGSGFDWDKLFAKLQNGGLNNGGGNNSGGNNNGGNNNSGGPIGDLVGFVKAGDIYTGSAITGATVTLSSGASTTSNGDGWYQFSGVPEGVVDIRVSASGYEVAEASDWVAAGATNWESVPMTATTGGGGGGYTPTGGMTVNGPGVTMAWPDSGASKYEVKVYWHDGSDWNYYYTWSTSETAKMIWPVVDDADYAWTVRAQGGQWSPLQQFWFAN